jgi:hypothetical protein
LINAREREPDGTICSLHCAGGEKNFGTSTRHFLSNASMSRRTTNPRGALARPLSVTHGAGLRGCEIVMLRVGDIDSQRAC